MSLALMSVFAFNIHYHNLKLDVMPPFSSESVHACVKTAAAYNWKDFKFLSTHLL